MKTFYELGLYGYDGNSLWFFVNEQHKTQEQFQSDFHLIMRKYGKEYIDSEDSYITINDWMEFIVPKMAELGYEQVEPVRAGILDPIIIELNGNGENEDSEIEELIDAVGIELVAMAQEKNNKPISDHDDN